LKALKSILNFLIQYNFIVAFGAVALSLQTMLLIKQELKFNPYTLLIFLACLLDYNIHRLIKTKYQNHFQKSGNIKSSFIFNLLIVFLSLATSINLFFISEELYFDFLCIAALTLAYTLPFVFKNKYINLIKKIPFLKTAMLAFVWTYLTVNIPIKLSNTILNDYEYIALFTGRFLFISVVTLPFEMRDKETDLKDGVLSLAHILTFRQLHFLAFLMLGIMNVIMCWYLDEVGSLALCIAFVISSALLFWLIQYKKIQRNRYYYQVFIDGALIIQFLLVYFFAMI
jgi:hypothetical protein